MPDALTELYSYILTHSGEMSANRPALTRLYHDVCRDFDELKRELEAERGFALEAGLEATRIQAEFEAYREAHPDRPRADIDAERIEDAYHEKKDGEFLGKFGQGLNDEGVFE